MKKRKSAKQLVLERAAALEIRKAEIEAEYEVRLKEWKEIDYEGRFPFPERGKWIQQKLDDWESRQPLIISGQYQDREKIVSQYHQKFVAFIRQLCPKVIEELRAFVPLFDRLFGENKDGYVALFNWYKVDVYDLNQTLDSFINSFIPHYQIIQFRPFENWGFRHDYKWGENRVLLQFIYWLFEQTDNKKREDVLQDTLELLQKNLILQRASPNFPTKYDETTLQQFTKNESRRIFGEFIKNREDSYFTSNAKGRLLDMLKNILGSAEPDIKAFVSLQIELFKWAEEHNLEKDWLLKYAYDFLKQFSNNPNLKGSEVVVSYLNVRSLAAFPFKFKFDGWIAGDEEKEKYETRLRESFESALEGYFQQVGHYFVLENIKKITRPANYDRVKWLVRWTVQGWSKEQILNEIDDELEKQGIVKNYDIRTVELAFQQFTKYDLPVRT